MDERDPDDLVAHHIDSLEDSIVGALGPRYVRTFYRYLSRSPKEILVVERSGDARIAAAAVVTLDPSSLTRRLARHTPLLPCLLLRAAPLLVRWLAGLGTGAGSPPRTRDHADAGRPEMILIYTARGARGRGLGTALVQAVERELRSRRVTAYQARTVLAPSNRALAFYRARGFEPAGESTQWGRRFQVFVRRIAGDSGAVDDRTGLIRGAPGAAVPSRTPEGR